MASLAAVATSRLSQSDRCSASLALGHEQIACRGRNVGGFVFPQQIRPCATSTLIELIWLSEISDSSVQILEQIEMPVNPGRGKMADSVPFSLRRPMAAHLLSESPFVSRKKCAV
jgi:hypothetical protein